MPRRVALALVAGLCALGGGIPLVAIAAGHSSTSVGKHDKHASRTPVRGRLIAIPHFRGKAAETAGVRAAASAATSLPSPPFRECPAIGADQSCGVLIYVTNSGAQVLSDPSQGPYDGDDDTLVGVLNASSKALSSVSLSSNTGIFDFDGDGICTYSNWPGDSKCPYGPTGYEGPGTHFGATSGNSGPVIFGPTLVAGGSAYFGLENALSAATLVNTKSYAALGDSYSAGNGTKDSSYSASCVRGPKAWPMLFGTDAGLSIVGTPSSSNNSFFACSGATSSDELHGNSGQNQPDQVSELQKYAARNGTPGLLTITAGGDDVKFASVLTTCYVWGGSICTHALKGALTYLTTGQGYFEHNLKELYVEAAKAAGAGAKLEVVGYPRIFPSSLGWFDLAYHCDWLATVPSGLTLIREITTNLNDDIEQAAGRAHDGYVSIENALNNHELCRGESWLADLSPHNGSISIAGHPLLKGQEAMASTVLQQLDNAGVQLALQNRSVQRAASNGNPSRRLVQQAQTGLSISATELPAATIGGPYEGYLLAAGGTEPYTWSISKGSLPPGLTLEPSTGVISGEPTSSATNKFTVTVTDSESPTVSASAAVSIASGNAPTLSASTEALATGTVGQQYEATLASSGGSAPVTWQIESGSLPAGLSLEPETGAIFGTPTAAGTSTVTFKATDASTPTQSVKTTLVLKVVPETEPLAVLPTKPPAGKAGNYYALSLNSTGGVTPITWSVSSGTLPEGLELNSSTGQITGLATSAGTYPVTVTAADRSTPTHTASVELRLVIEAPTKPTILTSTLPASTQGSQYVTTLNAEGGVPGYSWGVTSGSLPPGVTLNTSSGALEGIPSEAGAFTFAATVYDGSTPNAQSATDSYTMKVEASSPSITFAPPEATIGVPYSYTPSASGGVEPYTWSVSSGELPAGLSFEEATGTINGTPTATGSSPLTVRLADSSQPVPQSVTSNGTLTVAAAPPLEIESASLPTAINGQPYRAVVFVSGGTEPYTFSVTHGSLPTGVTLESSTGVLVGTPEAEGAYEFTLKVSDSEQPSQSRTATFKVTVSGPPALSILTTELGEANAGTEFAQTLVANGGTTPYTWSVTSGSLPPGLTLVESTGEIIGTPTEAGSFSFTAKATDSSSPAQSATVALGITVNATSPLGVTTSSLESGMQGDYYDQTVAAEGGVSPDEWSVSSGSLPEGLSLDPESGTIYGTPTAYGTSTFTIKVTDASVPTEEVATAKLSIRITPAPPFEVSATSLPAGEQGDYYDQSLGISGGVSPYTITTTAGALPEGLAVDQYGEIYGEITSEKSETFTLTIRDGSTPHAQSISRQYTIGVTPAGPLKLAASAASFVVGEYGQEEVGVTGGVPGYSWTVTSSKLPAGLSFSNGYIYGTPTKSGKGDISLTVIDSATPTAHEAKGTVSVKVGKPAKLKIATKKLPNATHGDYYQESIAATGGVQPLTWSIVAGAPPPGMSLSGETIYGTPEAAGTYSFTIKVTDSSSPKAESATKSFKLKVS